MILTCPECATRYQTDAAKFPSGGRSVRCAKCGHVWHQAPPQPEPDEETFVPEPAPAAPVYERVETPFVTEEPSYREPLPSRITPDPDPYVEKPAMAPGVTRRLGLVIGWALFITVVLAIGWAGLTFRQEIAAAWPQSASLYNGIGMPVNTRGIEFQKVAYHSEEEGGQPVLAVTGELVNISEHALPVPQKIRVGVSDEQKREIYSYTFVPDVKTLEPGQAVPFRTRLANPPSAARNLEVRFARDGE
jgi:predicted Zn finger-like uncharacterized protein